MKCISPHCEMPMNEHVYTWISTYPAEQKLATSQQGSATPKTSKGYKVAGLPVDLSVGCCVVCGSYVCGMLIGLLGGLIGW